ncbi:MAG: hypothetical protein ACJ71G_02630 [Nitrososphaeraceae archaeon]
MVGCNPRFQVAIMIVEILEKKYPHSLTNKELNNEVNLYCKGKEPSSATFTNYLYMLSGRKSQYYISFAAYKGVVNRRVEENRSTHYSLTKEFKDSLDRQKAESPTTYIENALSLSQSMPEADDEKPIEIIEHSENEESPEDKKI